LYGQPNSPVRLKLYSTKALNLYALAGLLTYSFFETSFPSFAEQWRKRVVQRLSAELTAAGLFRICT
jgi:hypothetical protein